MSQYPDANRIQHFNPKNANTPVSILSEYRKTGVFGGGNLGKAFETLINAKERGSKIFVALAGAMIPGGMREVIVQSLKTGLIDLLVTTGANCTHDLIEAFGNPHLKDIPYTNDKELRDKGIDRIYDAFVSPSGFPDLEVNLQRLLKKFHAEKSKDDVTHTSSQEILQWLGSQITDEQSFIRAAFNADVSIYAPAISDSVLGLQIWLRSQYQKIIVDELKDLELIQTEFHESQSTCALILGGGVPKNYMLQSSLMSNKEYTSGVSVSLDQVETGGLSGATLEEAVSWGKLTWEAPKVELKADTTIVFPLLVSGWLEYLKLKNDKEGF